MPAQRKMPIEWLTSRIGDYTDDAILITEAEPVSAPGPRIVWCNAAFTHMTGYELEDVKGLSPRILQGEDTDRTALARIRAALETWQKVRAGLKNYRKDGSAFWVDLGIHPVADEDGWFHYWVSIQREIPAPYESDLLVQQAKSAADHAPVALGLLDHENRLVFANETFSELIFGEAFPPALPFPYEAWLRRGVAARAAEAPDGTTSAKWIDQHLSALRSSRTHVQQKLNGQWYEFRLIHTTNNEHLIIAENVDDKVLLQQQVRQMAKLEAMGQLTGGVAHDFNNLLAVILGNAELASAEGLAPDEQAQILDEIIKAARTGRSLTQSLLSFAGKSYMSPETVRAETIVHDAVEIFRRTLGAALEISLEPEPDLPPIHIDVGLLKNALLNLLINARDSTASGGVVTISISVDDSIVLPNLANDARAAEAIKISVADEGEGMTDTVLARCIEPFFSTKRAGSGLGLSMVHGFAVQSGGKIEIESAVGRGTTVTMYLPSVSSKTEHSTADVDPEPFDLAGRRILVVEDDPAVSNLLRRLLEGVGATVDIAVTGDDALSKKEQWPSLDALVSDVVMPGSIQGDTLAKIFADAHPHKPIVLFTGNPEMVRETLRPSEKFELLAKPVERAVFLSAVSKLLRAPQG